MFKKSSLPKILLIFLSALLSILLLCAFILFFYYHHTINNFQETHIEELIEDQKIDYQNSGVLEEGSIVKKNDFYNFLLFTEYNQKSLDGLFTPINSNLVINKDFQLPSIIKNHCPDPYCFQYRLPIHQMPLNVLKALMAVEDSRFLEHSGIDLKAIARALWKDLMAMKLVEGASTLTQQLVKNLYLTNEKSFKRKFNEMIISYYLEKKYSKEEIISIYLNEVFWGNFQSIKVKGVYAASLVYFNKKPQELNFYESLLLVSMLKGPNLFNPKRIDLLKPRLTSLVSSITKRPLFEVKEEWIWNERDWKKWGEKFIRQNGETYFRQIYNLKNFTGLYLDNWSKYILWGEFERLNSVIKKKSENQNIDYALKFGVFNKDFLDENNYTFFYSKIERSTQKALKDEKHQVGSILKPIIYQTFLDLGKKLDDLVSTKPIKLKLKSGVWAPREVSKSDTDEMTLLHALQKSKNNPVIRIGSELGFDNVENKLKTYVPQLQLPLAEFPSQLLGSVELSVWDVAKTYQLFIKDLCQKITNENLDFKKSILYLQASNQETTIAHTANNILKEISFFGKTGTTNQGKDAWFVGFDGKNIYIVWVGVETNAIQTKNILSGAQSAFGFLQGYLTYNGKRLSESSCNF